MKFIKLIKNVSTVFIAVPFPVIFYGNVFWASVSHVINVEAAVTWFCHYALALILGTCLKLMPHFYLKLQCVTFKKSFSYDNAKSCGDLLLTPRVKFNYFSHF